jgi:hypothetical protein
METDSDQPDDRDEVLCPACGRRPWFKGRRNHGRTSVYHCDDCGLLFDVTDSWQHGPPKPNERIRGQQGRLFDS